MKNNLTNQSIMLVIKQKVSYLIVILPKIPSNKLFEIKIAKKRIKNGKIVKIIEITISKITKINKTNITNKTHFLSTQQHVKPTILHSLKRQNL